MAICITSGGCDTSNGTDRYVRILRWMFRRDHESIVCELGLSGDESAYELRLTPPWNSAGMSMEVFDDAMSAFQRHAVIERSLVRDGWMLEGFESEHVRRRTP